MTNPGFQNSLEPAPHVAGQTTVWNNSWRHIYEHFSAAIVAFARRQGLNEHSAEDVLQEVMTTLIRWQHGQASGYDRAGGSFQAWLWGVIRNRVRSVRRKDHKELAASPLPNETTTTRPRLPEVSHWPDTVAAQEEQQWQKALLTAALENVRARVEPSSFAIYTALLREEAPLDELARKHGKEVNNLYAIKHRCEKMLIAEAQALRQSWEQLRDPPTE